MVWAETAIPAYVRYDRELMDWVRDLARDQKILIYTGFPDAQREADGTVSKFNSSGLFNRQGMLVDRYAKYHLLPIGEAMPFTRHLPFLAKIDVGQAEWAPGAPPQVINLPDDVGPFPFSGLICFESILGRLARESVRQGSGCLIVLTNDGWFGKTAGPVQHAALARMRSAECGVPLIRCANNGISLVTDERGRVLDSLPLGRAGLVAADLKPGTGGTLFVRLGNTPPGDFSPGLDPLHSDASRGKIPCPHLLSAMPTCFLIAHAVGRPWAVPTKGERSGRAAPSAASCST